MKQTSAVLMLGIVIGVCGCATTGYHRASETRSVIINARAETAKLHQQVEATVNALQALTGSEPTALRPLYENFFCHG